MNSISRFRFAPGREAAACASALLLTAGATLAIEELPIGFGVGTSASFTAEATIGGTTIGVAESASYSAAAGFVAIAPANAPFGVLPPVAIVQNTDATVSALLQDDVQVVSATLNYRVGGEATYTQLPMSLVDAGSGEWSAVIPGSDVTARGVQYYVDASDGVNVASVPAVPTSLTVQVSGHPAFSLTSGVYALAGAPIRTASVAAEDVFAALGPYDPTIWRFGTFNPATASYREGVGAAPVVPGQGFWVIAADAASIAVNGTSTDLSGPVSVPLQPGFNQIANPFAFPVDFADLGIPGGVDANLIGWTGTAYVNGVPTLAPNTGYWIYNDAGTAVTLTIPPLGAGAPNRQAPAAPGTLLTEEEDAWSVHVVARAGGFSDRDNRFGMRPAATDEKDVFDLADAPAPPSGFALVSLVSADRALLTDWREPSERGATWTLELRTDQVGESFAIEFAPDLALPSGWELRAISEDGFTVVDLMETGAIFGRVAATDTRKSWTITAGLPAFVEDVQQDVREGFDARVDAFAFSPPFPNPVRGGRGTSFELRTPETTRARIDVFDVTGRRVATILDDTLAQGAHRIAWDGSDARGQRSASGVYFVQVQAGDFSRREKVVLVR